MASTKESGENAGQTPAEEEEEEETSVHGIQSRYLRCPSPSFSMVSESRFSAISGSDAASIFMEPIHLSSAVAAKKIINEELPPRGARAESVPESLLESAEQLMVEDLYNRVRDMMDDRSPYNTPCVLDIQRAMVQDRLEAPPNSADEVWPNIFIAEKSVAVNKARLKRMGVTHVLNAAHGTGVYTSQSFYAAMGVRYLGIELDDFPDADIALHFRPAAEFLDEALLTHKGKVLVVSVMGASRAAVLVAAYLMIFQNMTIMEALSAIREKRPVNPNEGFLKQLREFNESLLEEREDDDDTLSQCSVVDARARAKIFGDGDDDDDDDTDKEEEQSVFEATARSIMMEEEEDGESVMSSVASSAAAAAATLGKGADDRGAPQGQEEVVLPDGEDDEGLSSLIQDWQRRNERYQSEDWWQAQLNSEDEDGDGDGLAPDEAESVSSQDVRALRDRVRRRTARAPSAAASASSCSSYSDLWKQRLREIEEEAAARYRRKEEEEEEGGEGADAAEGRAKKIEEEVESILSDTTSMYNFCQKNKDKMTPLERWRVKRIQFGWNKKEREDGEKSSVGDGENGEGESRTPSLQDVDLTAYQSWKLRQQKRFGEEDKDEILELSRAQDPKAAKRRQRREELLERSRRTLEESQSVCGWDDQSCVSGGTLPLSAFWAGPGPAAPPSVANDDSASVLSGRSSAFSSVSRGSRSSQPGLGVPPLVPVPCVPGPGGEPLVNLSSIQNWIANVVSETLRQKQSEMSAPPASRAGSELSFGAAASLLSGYGGDEDRASSLSGASCPSALSQARGRAPSVLSGGGSSSVSAYSSRLGAKKDKITTTSVPLFSLFQDEVDMGKLDAMDKEIKSGMRDKMAVYEKKKILEENKRSTLYKKKKPKEEEEEGEEEEERKKAEEEFLEQAKKKEKAWRSYGLSGCLKLNPALEKDKNTSIDDWLRSVRPPQRKQEVDPTEDLDDDLDASASEVDFSRRRASYSADEEEDEAYETPSRYRSRLREDLSDEDAQHSCNGFLRPRSRTWRSEADTEGRRRRRSGREEGHADGVEDDIAAFIAQTRQRIRARTAAAAAEADDDEVLAAWRAQQEARSKGAS